MRTAGGIPSRLAVAAVAALSACALACGPDETSRREGESLSPTARPDVVDSLREDLAAARHPADGGGRAWLEPGGSTSGIQVSGLGHWTILYEAGPRGVAEGGSIFLLVPPFWGWSTPQVESPEAPGFTEVTSEAQGVELEAFTADQQLLAITVGGRDLAPGERVRIAYGAGVGAVADRYAERGSRFWIAVDGDGDGVRELIADSPAIDILPAPAARLVAHLPGVARPGERVGLSIAVLDAIGNAGAPLDAAGGEPVARLACRRLDGGGPCGLELPGSVRLPASAEGSLRVQAVAREEGVVQVEVSGPGALFAASNPLWISGRAQRVLWADLHGHSNFSDGTGTPEDYFRYARDIAALDVVALTDHDHWGVQPLAHHPHLWEEIRRQVDAFYEPGSFVTVLGYEWTSWLHGHRHVLYFADDGEVLSSVDPAYETPTQLWDALRGQPALTFAHHSAGGPVATNWDFAPDPVLEPVTEVASVHGSSEAPDSPRVIYSAVDGNFVRDVLDRGYRLGFIGSGDSHDGHPGLTHIASSTGGLAAILSEERSREGVKAALEHRRVYATNGPRILLQVALDSHPMGATVAAAALANPATLSIRIAAPAPLVRIDVVRSGRVAARLDLRGRPQVDQVTEIEQPVTDLRPGEYLYVRAVQSDDGAAWSSPFFLE